MHPFNLSIFIFLILVSPSSKASDSLFTPSHVSAISSKQYQLYRVQLNAPECLPLFLPGTVPIAIDIPEDLQPFVRQNDIQEVCQEVFGKSKRRYSLGKSLGGHELIFWRGTHSVPVHYRQEDQGLLRNEKASAWKKMVRGELIIGGIEFIGMAGLMLMPKEVTKWESDWLADAGRNLKRAFTSAPVLDKDNWFLNYVGHPVSGAVYYNCVRSQKATWFQSFLFSTSQSFIWEYLIEGIAEQPSVQDLIVTPVAGSVLGEVCHVLTMSMRNNGFNFAEKMATLILNPMFVINNGFGPKHNPVALK